MDRVVTMEDVWHRAFFAWTTETVLPMNFVKMASASSITINVEETETVQMGKSVTKASVRMIPSAGRIEIVFLEKYAKTTSVLVLGLKIQPIHAPNLTSTDPASIFNQPA